MSAALSGGQEITSAFSRSLYYATPRVHPLTRTYVTLTCRHAIEVYVCVCMHVCMRARGHNTTRSEDEAASYVGTYLPYLPTYLSRRYVCTQAACVPRGMAEIPRANNNATSCKWDGYPYTCRRDDV